MNVDKSITSNMTSTEDTNEIREPMLDIDWNTMTKRDMHLIFSAIVNDIMWMDNNNAIVSFSTSLVYMGTNMRVITDFNVSEDRHVTMVSGAKWSRNRIELLQLTTDIINSMRMKRLEYEGATSIDLSTEWINSLRFAILSEDLDQVPDIICDPTYSMYRLDSGQWSSFDV